MELLQTIDDRYSVRKYLNQPIETEKIKELFQMAQAAPSAANFQPVRYFILESDYAKEQLPKITKYVFNAPMWILIGYDKHVSWTNRYSKENKGEIDCAIAITHLMLGATSLGLGTCWVGSFDAQRAKQLFELKENIEPVALLPIGYPDLTVPPNPLHFKREPINNHIKKI